MKIIVDNQIPFLEDFLTSFYVRDEIILLPTSEINRDIVKDADALFVRTRTRCNASLLGGSNVRFIGTATIGMDHIDIPWCEANGIAVVNAPGSNASGVMLYTAATLLISGFVPGKHTLGVVGKGSIGSLVTQIFRNAGTKVIVSDPPRADSGLTDENYLPLQTLLESCDAVSFHVPYTEEGPYPTRNLLNGRIPENVKIIVNASRGGVVEPGVILREGGRRKLVIDTWPFEDSADEYDTRQRQELLDSAFIATPHIAGYTMEGKLNASRMVYESFREFTANLKGEEYTKPAPSPAFIPNLDELPIGYDPLILSQELKTHPDTFEQMRADHLFGKNNRK